MKHYDWYTIQEFYDAGNSMRQVTEKFGVTHKALSKASKKGYFISRSLAAVRDMKKSQILTDSDNNCIHCGSHKGKNAFFCSINCQMDFSYQTYIERWKLGLETGIAGTWMQIAEPVRRYIFEKYNSKCCKCGWNEIHPTTKKIPLQIDHIDGNSENNKEDNLQLLCPNCHSLTPTYGSLNKGSGRAARREAYVRSTPIREKSIKENNKTKEQLKLEYDIAQQKYIQKILASDIDFSKYGWVVQVSKIINKEPGYVRRWMRRNMPDFLSTCYTDVRTGSSY